MHRTLSHVAVCLAAIAAGFAVPGIAPADEAPLAKSRVQFTVMNPQENNAPRTIVGFRYDPSCRASTVVLLQHGLSYHKEAWDTPGYSVAQPLARAGYAVVAIDRLGYGESRLENGNNVSVEAYGHMTDQIVTQLRSEFDRVILGGHSAGAGTSEFAQGVFGSGDAVMALGWHHRPSDQIGKDFFGSDTPRSLQDDYTYFLETPEHRAWMFYEPDADPAIVEADTRAANLTPSGEIQTIGKQPSRYVVGNVKVPVFIQLSEKDRLFEPQYGDLHAAEFASSPSVTVDIVPTAGHTFMLAPQGPAGTTRMVDWLRSRPEAPACS
ncbi:MAG: alpha/beta hydrolase [Acidimicrobiia bacterium]